MTFETLRRECWAANMALKEEGLIVLTWGNASQLDREKKVFAIKPSGVSYDSLKPEDIVIVNLDGETVDGTLRPSSDTPTHAELYKAFPSIGGVVHTHSRHATAWAQSGRDLPCLGTTHADLFYGSVPCTRQLKDSEIAGEYEKNTGLFIAETFKTRQITPSDIPAVLVVSHGPFTWGKNSAEAVQAAVTLEEAAAMAAVTVSLNPGIPGIKQSLLDRHYLRKHGKNAYYGQK
jgi:L-ribulose-5-phosphate 4-epimerase